MSGSPIGSPYQVACGEWVFAKEEFLEMVKRVDGEMKGKRMEGREGFFIS